VSIEDKHPSDACCNKHRLLPVAQMALLSIRMRNPSSSHLPETGAALE